MNIYAGSLSLDVTESDKRGIKSPMEEITDLIEKGDKEVTKSIE